MAAPFLRETWSALSSAQLLLRHQQRILPAFNLNRDAAIVVGRRYDVAPATGRGDLPRGWLRGREDLH